MKLLFSERPLSLGVYSSDELSNYPQTNFELEPPGPVARLETHATSVEYYPAPTSSLANTEMLMGPDVKGLLRQEPTGYPETIFFLQKQ